MVNFQLKLGIRSQKCAYNRSMGKWFGDVSTWDRIADPSESGLCLNPAAPCAAEI